MIRKNSNIFLLIIEIISFFFIFTSSWIISFFGEVTLDEIIFNCITNKVCYDLVQGEYSENIINPSYTDIEIINSTFHIISMMNNTNQYITEKIDVTALSKSIE